MADLYDRMYVSTSTYFAHANPASLQRHVNADRSLADSPTVPWVRRSPVRLADACVGLLAAHIAERNATPTAGFIAYAEAHAARTLMPMVIMAAKGLGRPLKPARFLAVSRDVRELRRYLAGPAIADPAPVVEARIRATFDTMIADRDLPADALRPVKDYLVAKLLRELHARSAD